MNTMKKVLCVIAIPFGAFVFVYGGYDDSPGAQLLGLLIAVAGIVGLVRDRKKTPQK